MALAHLQRALATLYTDEPARERFSRDPRAFADEFSLTDAERAQILAVGETRIHAYADGLDRKRASEATRMLPLSARTLGPAFRRAFLAFARVCRLGAGSERYRDDAIAFARSSGAHPLAAFEGALLEHALPGRAPVRIRIFAIDVRATVRAGRIVPGNTASAFLAFRSEPLLFRLPSADRDAAVPPRGPMQG